MRRVRRGAVLLIGFAASVGVASSQQVAPEEASASGMIRLADWLGVAKIDSPLQKITAAESLEQLGEVKRERLLEEDFENFDMEEAGWRASRGVGLRETEEGKAFVFQSLGFRSQYGWVIPAEPGAHYVFERSVKTAAPLHADLVIVEAQEKPALGISALGRHYMAGRGLALKVHWPLPPAPDGTWQRNSVSFFTTPRTRSIAIFARSTLTQRESARADDEIWLDDIRLERVQPTAEQTIALLKAQSLAPGADPELGIEKYGQFPPIGEIQDHHTREDDNFSYRYALYAPTPTDLTFPVLVPDQANLRFSATLSEESTAGSRALFTVLIRLDNEEKELWSRSLGATQEEWRWHDTTIDLAEYSGRAVELILQTRAEEGHPQPMWGNPVVDGPPPAGGPHNVILIAVDTLRADRLSCYGYAKETTPNIDKLAADGVRFDQVAANANWTCPSFASIFTGMVPSRHGVLSYGPATPIPLEFETMAERFRAEGWATHSISYKPPLYDGGFEQGFDVSFNVPRDYIRADDNLAEAMEWLEANAGRRNFLFLHFNDPHQPFTQPKPFDRAQGKDPEEHGLKLPLSLYAMRQPRTEEGRDVMRDLYDGEVAYADDRIGMFLDALRDRGLYDDAVIGFVADHGEQLWEHGGFGHGPTFGWGGNVLFDEVIRVPLIIKPARGEFGRGKVVGSQVRGFDVMPSLLELAGVAPPADLDAESLVAMLGPEDTEAADRVAVIETSGGSIAVRNTKWKYILHYGVGRRDGEVLYHLTDDPGEKEDLAEQAKPELARLRIQALDYFLLRRPGHYLVVMGDGEASYDLRVNGVSSAVPYVGLSPEDDDGDSISFKGTAAGRLALVADLAPKGEVAVVPANPSLPVKDWRRYTAGELERLLLAGSPGVHLFKGPPRVAPEAGPVRSMDARQLEALKALGYIEDDGEGDGKKHDGE